MSTADLVVQKAVRNRLLNTAAVIDLVPAGHILDRNGRPNPDPAIVMGEGQCYEGDDLNRSVLRVVMDLHIWKKETSTVGVKTIAWQIRKALHGERLDLDTGWHCADARVAMMRYLRDPDGETSHAVVTVETTVSEA